jgi:AbrB family looped-hinge helix DNA binding protein
VRSGPLHGRRRCVRRSLTGRGLAMRVTSKGQVTIPIAVRHRLGIFPRTEVDFEMHGNTVRLVKAAARRATGRGAGVVMRLRGSADVRMSTDEILALTRRIF